MRGGGAEDALTTTWARGTLEVHIGRVDPDSARTGPLLRARIDIAYTLLARSNNPAWPDETRSDDLGTETKGTNHCGENSMKKTDVGENIRGHVHDKS